MGDQKLNFKNFKQRGEWVEMLFMARAVREGLQVSKPYGESASYDFIVESGSLCSRIQVKSTLTRTHNGFVCNLRCSASRTYDLGSFDFAAVHVIPLEVCSTSRGSPKSASSSSQETWIPKITNTTNPCTC